MSDERDGGDQPRDKKKKPEGVRDLVGRALEWLADALVPPPTPVPVPVRARPRRR